MSTPQTPSPTPQLTPSYEPAQFETKWYEFWEKSGSFQAQDQNAPGQDSFCIVIPPPNVTGVLHMGHALTNTIQDILIRWRRMSGDNTLWLPGTDHAGIATQAQVEKTIAKEGKGPSGRPLTRHDLGREKFLARTWRWKEDHESQIKTQLRRMGSSLDWSRERFTMDEGFSNAVREVFVRLYEENLIYRGERLIQWCTRCRTALSDLEVIPTERKGSFWHILYPVVDDQGDPISNADGSPAQLTIATTRPETLLGDTAVAVHPEDERYQAWIGKKVRLPLVGRLIPVIADEYVDRTFGSGVLKITPAHDFNDHELGKKHRLPLISVMGKDGKITEEGGAYAGLSFKEAREKMIQELKDSGSLVKTEDHTHPVGLCQRCDTVAEPILSKQWFVAIQSLAQPAMDVVREGKVEFVPKTWEKTYFEWMENIRDWCISRQLWWGHQIPAWYCAKCEGITVARASPPVCVHCQAGPDSLRQDEDVLDTWFSSSLWPFCTLGWPEQTQALKTFYPTAILETGFDILFFWVARMMMMGLHFMKEVPFKKVYLHAMVRDEKGEKMSKSKGNVIDPLSLIDLHGADPLRFTLAIMAGQGRDIKLSVDRVEGYRAFCNKLWNAVKFFHLQWNAQNARTATQSCLQWNEFRQSEPSVYVKNHGDTLLPTHRWILGELTKLTTVVQGGFERFELNVAAQALYDFTWHEFCDWFIEFSKLALRENGRENANDTGHEKGGAEYSSVQAVQTVAVLGTVLETLLRLMHPLMPFVTEELWHSLPWHKSEEQLMLQAYPQANRQPHGNEHALKTHDSQAERIVSILKEIIQAIRNFRGENRIPPKVEFDVSYQIFGGSAEAESFMLQYAAEIRALGRLGKITADVDQDSNENLEASLKITLLPIEFRISLKGLVNVEEERQRLQKELNQIQSDLDHVRKKLGQDTFLAKAPAALIEKERSREQELQAKQTIVVQAFARLGKLSS